MSHTYIGPYKLYVDMDGVLADFMCGAEKVLGRGFDDPHWKGQEPAKKALIAGNKDFWATLPPMQDFSVLWGFLAKYNPHILSAYAQWDKGCQAGKLHWIKTHVPTMKHMQINLVQRHEKQKFAIDKDTGRPNVLIDDYEKNITEFERAGGIGIHHIGAKSTIYALKRLGFA